MRPRYDFEFLEPAEEETNSRCRPQTASAFGGAVQATARARSTQATRALSAGITAVKTAKIKRMVVASPLSPYDVRVLRRATLAERARALRERVVLGCRYVVTQKWFNALIMTLILLGTLLLAFDSASLERDKSAEAEAIKRVGEIL